MAKRHARPVAERDAPDEGARDTAAVIARRNLHDETADRIRMMILGGDLAPGARIAEQALCARFGVSRTPVREALKALATEGLVTITPNRGASVTELSVDDLGHVFPVVGALEALAGELAANRMSDADIAHVVALHEAMVEHFHARDLGQYFAANQAIHDALLAGADNPVLTDQYRQLAARMRLARYRANMSDERWAQAVAEHEQMIDALRNRRAKTLARILRTHIDNKFETVKEAVAR